MTLTIASAIVLILGNFVTVAISIVFVRQRLRKGDADIDVTKSDAGIKTREAAKMDLDREQQRDKFWQEKLNETERRCDKKIETQSIEIEALEIYVDRTVPWIWEAVRDLTKNSIPYKEPPSLPQIRREVKSTRNSIGLVTQNGE